MTHTLRISLAAAALAVTALSLVGCTAAAPGQVLGTWGTANTTGEPWLVFEEDGSFNGSDGCNGVFGSYTVSGDTVSLDDMGSTLMFCEGVDTWLSEAASARVDGDTLIVRDQAETEIGTLERAE